MSITTRDWTAQIDLMPGAPSFRVIGTVAVANPGVTPKLILSGIHHSEGADGAKVCDLTLDLTLESAEGNFLQVVTDKPVKFEDAKHLDVTSVSIVYQGKLLQKIDDILTTH